MVGQLARPASSTLAGQVIDIGSTPNRPINNFVFSDNFAAQPRHFSNFFCRGSVFVAELSDNFVSRRLSVSVAPLSYIIQVRMNFMHFMRAITAGVGGEVSFYSRHRRLIIGLIFFSFSNF